MCDRLTRKWRRACQLLLLLLVNLTVVTLSFASSYQHEPCDDVYNETCIQGNQVSSLHKFSIMKCLKSESALQNVTKLCQHLNKSIESVAVDTFDAFNSWMCANDSSFIDICLHTFDCKIKLTDAFYSTLLACSRKVKQQETLHLVCERNITHAVQRESSMFHCLKFTLDSVDGNATCWQQLSHVSNSTNVSATDDSRKFVEWFCKTTDARACLHKIESNCINNDRLSLVYGDCLRL